MNSRVLLIHNDPILCEGIKAAICEAAMIADTTFSPAEAINLFLRYDYNLIVFDIGRTTVVKHLYFRTKCAAYTHTANMSDPFLSELFSFLAF